MNVSLMYVLKSSSCLDECAVIHLSLRKSRYSLFVRLPSLGPPINKDS